MDSHQQYLERTTHERCPTFTRSEVSDVSTAILVLDWKTPTC